MALFLSAYTNKVDKKGRVSLPSSFRAALGDRIAQGVVVFRAHRHDCLEGFEWARMEEIGNRMDHFDLFSAEQDDLATTIFGESVQLFCDSEGRVILPAPLMDAVGIQDQATFVGLGRKFQIWSPELFSRRKEEARSAVREQVLTVPRDGTVREGGQAS